MDSDTPITMTGDQNEKKGDGGYRSVGRCVIKPNLNEGFTHSVNIRSESVHSETRRLKRA